jgi:hypothetical protein
MRGGSWNNNARNCRSANRNRNRPDNRNNNVGLRLVCLAAQEEQKRECPVDHERNPVPVFEKKDRAKRYCEMPVLVRNKSRGLGPKAPAFLLKTERKSKNGMGKTKSFNKKI